MESISQMPSIQHPESFQNPTISKNTNLLTSQKNSKWSPTTITAVTSAIASSVLGAGYFAYQYLTKATPPPVPISPYTNLEPIKTTLTLLVLGLIGYNANTLIPKFNRTQKTNLKPIPPDSNPQVQSKITNQGIDDKYYDALSILKAYKKPSDKNSNILNEKKPEDLVNIIIFLLNNNELEKVEEINNEFPQDLFYRIESDFVHFLANMSQGFIDNETIIKNSKNEIISFLDSINSIIIKKNKNHPDNIINFFNPYYGHLNFEPTNILLKILSEYKNDTEIEDRIFKLVYSFMKEATKKLSTENSDLQTDIERIISYFMDEHPKFYAHFIQHAPDSAGKFAFFYQKKCRDKNPFYLEFAEPFAFKILKDARTCLFQDSLDHTTEEIRNNEAVFAISFLGNYFVELDDQGKPPVRLIKLYNDLRNKETIEKTLNEMLNAKVKPCKASIEMAKTALEVHNRKDLQSLLKERESEIICDFFHLNHNIDPFKLLKLREQISQNHYNNSSDAPDSSQTDYQNENRLQ